MAWSCSRRAMAWLMRTGMATSLCGGGELFHFALAPGHRVTHGHAVDQDLLQRARYDLGVKDLAGKSGRRAAIASEDAGLGHLAELGVLRHGREGRHRDHVLVDRQPAPADLSDDLLVAVRLEEIS